MNDPKTLTPDNSPSPDRDTSREGREEEVINQQEGDSITNTDPKSVVNGSLPANGNEGEQQFKEGLFDNTVKLDEVEKENIAGSDQTGNEESGLPGSGI